MSKKHPTFNFEWVEDTSQFNEDFMKNFDEKSGQGYFPEVNFQYPKILYELHSDWPFLPENRLT